MDDKTLKEEQLTLELLDAIEKDSDISQRHLAKEMGIALGLANSYLKRCIKKGLIKIYDAPANRYLYYVTPKGFSEKSRLTASYLSYSFSFYRKAGESCKTALDECVKNGWKKLVLYGASDLAEIISIRAIESEIEVVAVCDNEIISDQFLGKPVYNSVDELDVSYDAFCITHISRSQEIYNDLINIIERKKIIIPDVLRIDVGNNSLD